MKILSLMLIIFLFSGCNPQKEVTPEKIFVQQSTPTLKNLKQINTNVTKIKLYKKNYDEEFYLVEKTSLKKASKNNQNLRAIVYKQNKQIKFYIYQNTKFNLLKENNETQKI